MIAGAVLLGVVGWILFDGFIWAAPFALLGGILGWGFTEPTKHDRPGSAAPHDDSNSSPFK